MVAASGRTGQCWVWAARQVGAPAGMPSGVAVLPQSACQQRCIIPVRSTRVVDGRLLAELLLAAMDVCKRWTVVALGEGTAVLECLR